MPELIRLSYFSPGVIVAINQSFLYEPIGVLAYVYECYDKAGLSGISLITENGVNLGGFNPDEQLQYLKQIGDTGKVYNFKNVIQLADDFEKLIKPLFSKWKRPV